MSQDLPIGAAPAPLGARAAASAARLAAGQKVFTTPLIGIAVYLFVIHSYKLPIAGAAVGLAVVGLLMEGRPLRVPAFLVWFAAWLLLGLASYLWSSYPEEVWTNWIDFAKVWLIVFVAVNAIRTPAQLLAFAITWLAMFALFPVRGTLFNILFGYGIAGRYAWNFAYSNPNAMAAYTLLLLALSVAVLRITPARWVRLCALTGVFVLPVIMFFTQSRGGLLGLALFVLLVFAGEQAKLKLLAVFVAAGGIIVMTAPAAVWDRIGGMKNLSSTATIADADEESSAEQRWAIWQVAGKVIAQHPVGGVGLGAYPKENAVMARATMLSTGVDRLTGAGLARGERDSHSMFLNITAETGFLGMSLYIGMLLSALAAGRKAERLLRRIPSAAPDLLALVALRAGMLGFLVCGVFGGLQREPQLYFMMTLIVHYSTLLLQAHRPVLGKAVGVPTVLHQPARGVA